MLLALRLTPMNQHSDSRICIARFTKGDLELMRQRTKAAEGSWKHDKLFVRSMYMFYGDIIISSGDCDLLNTEVEGEVWDHGVSLSKDVTGAAWNDAGHDDFVLGGTTIAISPDDMYIEVWDKRTGAEFISYPLSIDMVKESLR